ncbi:hypothetical protein [Pseudomonas sp. Q2-TVG4-2]|uniref:hypothetical protein n=1 Tax=Pseudomonas sp. Q2-TVG4-2 TaxID=1685699 RepID=UPI0015E6AFB8|nr:hypothetical protein [Pseudomonas sp. Q2-TVG4-2]
MMDWVMGAYGGIKAATDITQSMLTLKTDAAVTTKVVELNGVLLGLQGQLNSAHAEHTALASRIRDLEAEVTQFKNWEEEKERYQLHKFPAGTLGYRIKPAMQGAEPPHDLCANCYQNGVKSILQACEDGWYNALKCHPCGSVIRTDKIQSGGSGIAISDYDPYGPRGY